jgi:uracil-DNA glycosylase family 4
LDQAFAHLNEKIVACKRCPRLVSFRESVPFKTPMAQALGWRRPVPGFGDPDAKLLILGLAPSIEGGNRTGRIFTGDASARFLIPVLYRAGFASQQTSEGLSDGLQLKGCYITASVKCVPPKHRPTREEFINCNSYFVTELFLLKRLQVVLALGQLAFDTYQAFLKEQGVLAKKGAFAHGQILTYPGWPTLCGSYHPSPQNTQTGKLTDTMLFSLLISLKENFAI